MKGKKQGISLMIKTETLMSNTPDIKIVTGCTTDIGIDFYDIPTFARKFKMSKKTIRRRIESVFATIKEWWRYVQVTDKYYVSCGIIGFKKRGMRYFRNEDYSQFLRVYTWDIAGTVRAENCPTDTLAAKRMEKLFKALKGRYKSKQILFFYVTEENPGKDGFHNHFVLGIRDADQKEVIKWMESYLNNKNRNETIFKKRTNTFLEEHRVKESWIEYMVKQMDRLPDAYNWLDHGLFV